MTDHAPPNPEPSQPTPPPDGYKPKCKETLPKPEPPPGLPPDKKCPQPCCCPPPPGGPPSTCLDDLIRCQTNIVNKADRAKAFVEELTAIQEKVASAQVDYTQQRYKDLLKIWMDQDKAIAELVRKVVCAVHCWECLLECRLCPQLSEICRLEDRLNGTGVLAKEVFSLLDLQFWHQRNVANMQARVDRMKLVLAAWEKPSDTLGDILEKNGKLIEDTQAIIATDSAKAVYDIFMTLIPRHWAIRPRDDDPAHESSIDPKYIHICECDAGVEDCKCDDGAPDDCCGPDVGVLNLRQRLVGPLPYIVDPVEFPKIICCITRERLSPASDYLAAAQAELAGTTAEIEQLTKAITDKTSAIEASFRAELPNPIDCKEYRPKKPTPPPPDDGGCQDEPKQSEPKSAS